MNWSEVIADRSLHDLPYRIEMNGYGQIVRTPISNRHGKTLSQGAQEVWLCSEAGTLEFFSPAGALESSALFPKFPQAVK